MKSFVHGYHRVSVFLFVQAPLLFILLISIRPSHKAQLVPRSNETLVGIVESYRISSSSSFTSRVILSPHITTENSIFLWRLLPSFNMRNNNNLHSFKMKFISSLWRQKSNREAPQYSHTGRMFYNGEFYPSLERNETTSKERFEFD